MDSSKQIYRNPDIFVNGFWNLYFYGPVPENRILGVVVGRIPYIGWVKILLTDSGLLIPLLVIVSALLIISIIWDLFKKDEDSKDKKKGDKKLIYNQKLNDSNSVREIEIDYSRND